MQKISQNLSKNQFSKKAIIRLFSPQNLPYTIISFGTFVRLIQYLFNRSLWNDEAALALNIINRSYLELLQPLDYNQGAPIGFLMVEKLATQVFGNNEYALRLFPFLAAIASLFIFYKLAKKCSRSHQAAIIALTLFSTLHIWLQFATEVKQYSTDVAIAVLLYLTLIGIECEQLKIKQIFKFGIVGAVAIWFSHPVIFVLAGIGTSYLLISLFQKKPWFSLKLLAICSTWALSFGLSYFVSLRNIASNQSLFKSWAGRGTFPTSFWDFGWLFQAFVEFFHIPLGFPDVFLGIAIIAFLAGCISLFGKQKIILLALLAPILVTFFAAYLQKYPFNGRLVLFLIPFFILLIGEGTAAIRRISRNKILRKVSTLIMVLLLVPPVGTAAYLIFNPYTKQEIKPVLSYMRIHQQSGDTIYVYERAEYQFRYYAKKYAYQAGDYILGIDDLDRQDGQGISEEEWRRYTSDFDKLRGQQRVWILLSHLRRWQDEKERILIYLDSIGKRIDKFEKDGSFVYLYDFS
jgi:4-amino-4-deoxy-L-arabinose transferase-like glycosyltransferase